MQQPTLSKNEMINKLLTPKEVCDIKLSCVKMFVDTASKLDMKDDIRVLKKAELVWDFVVETLVKDYKELPAKGSK